MDRRNADLGGVTEGSFVMDALSEEGDDCCC